MSRASSKVGMNPSSTIKGGARFGKGIKISGIPEEEVLEVVRMLLQSVVDFVV